MNGKPHTHELGVYDQDKSWLVVYGDQQKEVNKPRFRQPEEVLKKAIADIIRTHDRESLEAGLAQAERDLQVASTKAIAEEARAKLKQLGSERCPNLKYHPFTTKCELCNNTGVITKRWGSEAMEIGE